MSNETNAERLEQIKTDWTEHSEQYRFRQLALETEEIDWLIEQAKLLQELKVVKWKNGRPTVIDWNGERWIYSPETMYKGGKRNEQ